MKNVYFLLRKHKRGSPVRLPKSVAVVSISETIDGAHYLFDPAHHSLDLHPELNRYVKDIPSKHRHVSVKLKGDHLAMYVNSATNEFQFASRKLPMWKQPLTTLTTLTGNYN